MVDALSVIVAKRYRGDAATLAEWKQVKHVVLVGARGVPAGSPAQVPVELSQAPVQSSQTRVQLSPTAVQASQAGAQESQTAAA